MLTIFMLVVTLSTNSECFGMATQQGGEWTVMASFQKSFDHGRKYKGQIPIVTVIQQMHR